MQTLVTSFSRVILNACIIPTCLSGCRIARIMNDILLSTVKGFQGYVGCRILKLPKFHYQLIPLIILAIPSMQKRQQWCNYTNWTQTLNVMSFTSIVLYMNFQ